MKTLSLYLIVLVSVFYSCSTDKTVTPPGEVVIIDRTGITDSMSTNFPPFVYSYLSNLTTLHITFYIKGDSTRQDNVFYLSRKDPLVSLLFHNFGPITSSYQLFDSTIGIGQFSDSIFARAYPLGSPTWIAVKDLKVTGQ